MRPKPDPIRAGQESVWGFPRPAIAEPTGAHIVIEHRGHRIADSRRTVRTLETSHPPSYYIPREDIAPGVLRRADGSSFCEWKGAAVYRDVVVGGTVIERVGWSYPSPTPSFAILRDHVAFYARPFDRCLVDGQVVVPQEGAFYARPFDRCLVDGQVVVPQEGAFYGGWITDRFAGPFKGGPGSTGW